MDTSLKSKVALVTGGGSGIGAAAAHALAAAGAAVAVVDYRPEAAESVAADLTGAGHQVKAFGADVRDEDAMAAAIASTVETFGGLHIVFANAGINGMQAPIEELTVEEWDETHGVNLKGTFITVKHAIPHLRAAGGGSIIVTASINGNTLFSSPGYAAYSSSKAGQVAFAKMAAIELARWDIRVNSILPGSVTTNIGERTFRRNLDAVTWKQDLPERWPPLRNVPADAADIANMVVFLSSEAGRHVTGTEIVIDGAQSLLRG